MRASVLGVMAALGVGLVLASSASQAAPTPPAEPKPEGPSVLLVDANSGVAKKGQAVVTKPEDIKALLVSEFARQQRELKGQKEPGKPALTLRIHRDCQYAHVVTLIDAAQKAGFEDISPEPQEK